MSRAKPTTEGLARFPLAANASKWFVFVGVSNDKKTGFREGGRSLVDFSARILPGVGLSSLAVVHLYAC